MLTRKSESGTWVTANDTPLLDANTPTVAEGERRLMIAVLVHALRSMFRDAEKPGRGALRRLRQDLKWITSPDRDDLFAFERIEPQPVRLHVLQELGAVTQLLAAAPPRRRSRQPQPIFTDFEPVRAVG